MHGMSSVRLLATSLILAIASSLAPLREATAANGAVLSFPLAGAKIKSGLTMTVDLRGVDANGYRPVRIEFRPLNKVALPADRRLRVVLSPYSYNSTLSPQVTQVVELPEGSLSTVATLAVPQCSQWWSCSIEVYEDGDKLDDLSAKRMGMGAINYWDWTEARPTTLAIDSNVPPRAERDVLVGDFKMRGIDANPTYKLPEVRSLMNLFPDPNRPAAITAGQQISDATLLSQLLDLPRLEMLPPAEVPERWIELSQYDLIVIPLSDLKLLAQNEPQRFKAVADWAAGGPLLIVYGVGSDFAGLAEIDQLLKLPRLPDDPQLGAALRGWRPADNDRHRSMLFSEAEDLEASMQSRTGDPTRTATMYATPTMPPPRVRGAFSIGERGDMLAAPAKAPFAIRPIGLGRIVAIASQKPFPGTDNDWIWVFNSVPRSHWMWYQRNGYSLHRSNSDYWTFLIPGVGEAPVVSFLLLVSLFAVLIGPVNYMLLGKARRLYLLLISVPAGAVLVTGGLFAHALLTDGLGVRLRARSFTEIDQASGRAVAWSRQSYYASIAPSRGLSFPEDATVFPILYQPAQRFSGNDEPDNKLAWIDGQHLTDGYLGSRTATQFMVLRTTESTARLLVRESSSMGQPPQVTNQLETSLSYLVLRDSRGQYWQAEKLASQGQAALATVTEKQASDRLQKLYGQDPPQLPRGYDPNVHNNTLSLFMPNYGWYAVDTSSSIPLMASSLLESNLAVATRPAAHPLASGTYVAVGGASPIVPYGVPRVREEASLHVIRGRY
jgi:hypothetical protein